MSLTGLCSFRSHKYQCTIYYYPSDTYFSDISARFIIPGVGSDNRRYSLIGDETGRYIEDVELEED